MFPMAEALSDTDLRALISGTPSDWNALWLALPKPCVVCGFARARARI
jgi:hypothetical protein